MKKILFGLSILFLAVSCNKNIIVTKAINTVNSVSLSELNLERKDYRILNTITAEASIVYSEGNNGKIRRIACPEEDFALTYLYNRKTGQWKCLFRGIVKMGYLTNDYKFSDNTVSNPEEVARRLAFYRIINMAKLEGADGVIEPIVSTNVDNTGGKYQQGVIFKTSVSAKLIKLKTDK